MLKIGLHVIDTKNYVKSLVTSHNAAILEKVRDVVIYFSRPSAILEKVRDVPISLILAAQCKVIKDRSMGRDRSVNLNVCQKKAGNQITKNKS